MEYNIDRFRELFILYGINILAALVILTIGWFLARLVKRLLIRVLKKGNVDNTLISFITNIVHIGIMVIVVISSLGQLGVKTASFIAILGAAGLAIGLALQGSLSNFAAGVLMILFKPFKAGDYIEGGGAAGIVSELKIFTTVLISPDNKKIIIPNNKLMSENIINHTAHDIRRIDLVVGISYTDQISKARKVIHEIASSEPRILSEPAPFIGVQELGDNSVNLAIWVWVNKSDYLQVLFYLREAIKENFDKANITIPFPQRELHFSESIKVTNENNLQ